MEKLVRELPDAEVVVLFKRISDECMIARPDLQSDACENVRSPSVIDFPFGGSAEDAIKEWPTLSNAANIKIREIFFVICSFPSQPPPRVRDTTRHWARTTTRPVI